MKYTKQIQFCILLIGSNLAIHCSQICNQIDLEQREQTVKKFIRRELEKGTSLKIIKNLL
jgi:hypothetical protein